MQAGTLYLFRSTTDKLAEHLNHIEESGDVAYVPPTFTGGRDWVIVCRKGDAAADIRDVAIGSPRQRAEAAEVTAS